MKVMAAAFTALIWFLGASEDGMGYYVMELRSEREIIEVSHDVIEQIISGHVKVWLNPFFFPISHACGSGTMSSSFVRYVPRHHMPGPSTLVSVNEIADALVVGELYKNLPLFFIMGLVLTHLTDKLVAGFSARRKR